jgi:hypothetical protein
VVRAAYTTDGQNFTDIGVVNGVNNPAYTGNAGDLTPAGQTGTDLLRYVGSRGTIIKNPDGSYTMFMSGADCNDADSDAFEQIFTSTSSDGLNWSTPVPLIKTDQTFSASAEQEAAASLGENIPLDVSAYYEGGAYDPTVIPNNNGTLTLLFSGYRTGKPLPSATTPTATGVTGGAGTPIGTDTSFQYTPGPNDSALYRSILTTTITEPSSGTGATGPGGTTGPAGSTGPAGPLGPQGAQGGQGSRGPRGRRGKGASGKLKCTVVSSHNGHLTLTCHTTHRAADVAPVKIAVVRGKRTLASGYALLKHGVITGHLMAGSALGHGSYRIVVSWPGGAQLGTTASLRA